MRLLATALLTLGATLHASGGSDDTWPREIRTDRAVIVVYQPQPEKLDGNTLTGRSAISVELDGGEPVFGVVWFSAVLETDRAERTATIAHLSVVNSRFPEGDETKEKKLGYVLEQEIKDWDLEIDLDRLIATLGLAEERAELRTKINTDPPAILVEKEPAVLVTIDGDPIFDEEDGADRVVNTPFTIFRIASIGRFYLYADKGTWYASDALEGPWSIAEEVPAGISSRAPAEESAEDEDDAPDPDAPRPKVLVATEPSELIVIEGEPKMTPIEATNLLYMTNTESDVVFDIGGQKYYVLLSGRWYASASLDGPWTHVPGEELPEEFAKIPEDAPLGTVLYAVPGTDVAEDAVLDAHVPQTATVDRNKAKLTVEYDGEPKFEPIEGTEMHYAVNTETPVVRVERTCYACDEAVWFVAPSPKGPWAVATEVPDVIYTIPPECPIYHVTFVKVYRSTPDVVYVGYTPGYTGCYVYHTTIVYGTGWYYRPWWRRYYYPRPCTFGFHVRYNPWSGWSFGFSYSRGPFRFTVGRGSWYRGGWWGPARYHGYRRGYRAGARHGARAGFRAGYRAGQRTAAHTNLYRSTHNATRTRPIDKSDRRAATQSARTRDRPNNLHADRAGNVHRRTDSGWESRQSGTWTRDATRGSPSRQPSEGQPRTTQRSSLERSHASRQRGSQRSSSYQRASGGARRGGGAVRRR